MKLQTHSKDKLQQRNHLGTVSRKSASGGLINVRKIAFVNKENTDDRLENWSLGFIETLHKQLWSLQRCLRHLAYTWAVLRFRRYHNGRNDPQENEI